MADIIHLLPDAVANQIAAGEVIQRPASIVKELMENAVDAEATRVKVIVTDAGKTLVQVIDDGKGMSETDARMAFERHATSKINAAADLFSIRTMGFRGEALPSIAAVAQVELRTRLHDEELGTLLYAQASQVTGIEPVACPVGSNFMVRDLFYNIPARRKFLKSNNTELSNIATEFERIALAHPDVAFSLESGGATLHNLASGTFHQRIVAIFGKHIDKQLIPVNVETDQIRITGFVGTPESSRRKGARQFFFANDRYMRHPYFARAVQNAFERFIPDGEQVPFFLRLEVSPDEIDVNIHPTKTEIKFHEEQVYWPILHSAVREAVGRYSAAPTIDFATADKPDIPIFNPDAEVQKPEIHYDPNYNPFATSTAPQGGHKKANAATTAADRQQWESVYASAHAAMEQTPQIEPSVYDHLAAHERVEWEQQSDAYMQVLGRYVLTPHASGVLMVDMHRAHIRVLYDTYKRQMAERRGITQGLLFPEKVECSIAEAEVLETLLPDLMSIGFDITHLGGGTYVIQGCPADTEGLNPEEMLRGLVAEAAQAPTNVADDLRHTIALTMAQRAAMPVGQLLAKEEMQHLLQSLFATDTPGLTPDGKPTFAVLSEADVKAKFS